MNCNRLCLLVLSLLVANSAQAGLVTGSFSFEGRADQSIRVPAGSPLTGAPFGIPAGSEFDLSALGTVTLGWESDADADGSVALTSFSANFAEVHPVFGPYALAAIGTGPGGGFSGSLDNVVENGGELVSADWTLNTTFSLTFTGVPGQPTIYTKDQATFTGKIFNGSANLGQVYTSLGDINGFLSLGDPNTDPLAAISFNRTVTAVPEPSSLAIFALSGCTFLFSRRSKRRS